MITLNDIIKKLGFNPLTYDYATSDHEDDSKPNPLNVLNTKELEALIEIAKKSNKEQ